MKITHEEFNERFEEAQDIFLTAMADSPEIDIEKFYSIACFLENLSFFSPVIFSMIKQTDENSDG